MLAQNRSYVARARLWNEWGLLAVVGVMALVSGLVFSVVGPAPAVNEADFAARSGAGERAELLGTAATGDAIITPEVVTGGAIPRVPAGQQFSEARLIPEIAPGSIAGEPETEEPPSAFAGGDTGDPPGLATIWLAEINAGNCYDNGQSGDEQYTCYDHLSGAEGNDDRIKYFAFTEGGKRLRRFTEDQRNAVLRTFRIAVHHTAKMLVQRNGIQHRLAWQFTRPADYNAYKDPSEYKIGWELLRDNDGVDRIVEEGKTTGQPAIPDLANHAFFTIPELSDNEEVVSGDVLRLNLFVDGIRVTDDATQIRVATYHDAESPPQVIAGRPKAAVETVGQNPFYRAVRVIWEPFANERSGTDNPITEYQIRRITAGCFDTEAPVETFPVTNVGDAEVSYYDNVPALLTGENEDKIYAYQVRARNAHGWSFWSLPIEVNKEGMVRVDAQGNPVAQWAQHTCPSVGDHWRNGYCPWLPAGSTCP